MTTGGGTYAWAVPGGARGSGPPFLTHVVGFLTLGPKLDPLLDPLFFACRPKTDPPLLKSHESAPGMYRPDRVVNHL